MTFVVDKREKPADYNYEENEVLTLNHIFKNGGGGESADLVIEYTSEDLLSRPTADEISVVKGNVSEIIEALLVNGEYKTVKVKCHGPNFLDGRFFYETTASIYYYGARLHVSFVIVSGCEMYGHQLEISEDGVLEYAAKVRRYSNTVIDE
jgi:hypothetical protein